MLSSVKIMHSTDFPLWNYSQSTGSVPQASDSRLSPLPPEPADFYNDRGATIDIPLDNAKVFD